MNAVHCFEGSVCHKSSSSSCNHNGASATLSYIAVQRLTSGTLVIKVAICTAAMWLLLQEIGLQATEQQAQQSPLTQPARRST